MSSTLTVACVQLNSADDITANINAVDFGVRKAAQAGATLIALPENAFLMDAQGAPRTLYTEDEHPAVRASRLLAKEVKAWLLVGSVAVKIDDSGKSVNRSLLISPTGDIAARYDKIHLFDVTLPNGETYAESNRMLAGAEAVLARLPEATLGMSVCYDVRFPALYRTLAQEGAQILAVPAAFTQTTGEAHWHVLLRARAIENGCFVLAPAQCGTHPGGRKTFGHSLIIDPWGTVLADGGTQTGIITASIDLSKVAGTRAQVPSLQHGRDFRVKTC